MKKKYAAPSVWVVRIETSVMNIPGSKEGQSGDRADFRYNNVEFYDEDEEEF